ncbi:MAG TPA: type II toxin-antitoxin system MqsA family antitoxin [Longimicrobium sp.]|nr:type II toxin-antitoxin system MqsA family antitoxin [Longimicrobium sp.]
MICGVCGGDATLVQESRPFPVGSRTVIIDDEFIRCARCGEEYYEGEMADRPFRRAAAVIRAEDGLLGPDEIVAIRAKYGLSQAALEQLIGAGEKTVVRWEKGTVAQNKTADTLLRVLGDHPEVVARLAEERGVAVRKARRATRPRASAKKVAPAPVRHARADAAG